MKVQYAFHFLPCKHQNDVRLCTKQLTECDILGVVANALLLTCLTTHKTLFQTRGRYHTHYETTASRSGSCLCSGSAVGVVHFQASAICRSDPTRLVPLRLSE